MLAAELTAFSPGSNTPGTVDLWAMGRDRMNCIRDWKSGLDVYPEHAVQLAAYTNAQYTVVDSPRPLQHAELQLKPKRSCEAAAERPAWHEHHQAAPAAARDRETRVRYGESE